MAEHEELNVKVGGVVWLKGNPGRYMTVSAIRAPASMLEAVWVDDRGVPQILSAPFECFRVRLSS